MIFLYDTDKNNLQTYIGKKLQAILNRLFNYGLEPRDTQHRAVVHTLRHTFAVTLIQNGYDISIVQNQLGHSDIKTTSVYTQMRNDDIKRMFLA